MILASVAILGGIALVILRKHHADGTQEVTRSDAVSRRCLKTVRCPLTLSKMIER
jgi:hypothetical protein